METTSAKNGPPVDVPDAPVDDITPVLDTIRDFFASHPNVKIPHYFALTVDLASRAELDAVAGDFDRPPPPPSGNYHGAQFSVKLMDKPHVTVVFSYYRGPIL